MPRMRSTISVLPLDPLAAATVHPAQAFRRLRAFGGVDRSLQLLEFAVGLAFCLPIMRITLVIVLKSRHGSSPLKAFALDSLTASVGS